MPNDLMIGQAAELIPGRSNRRVGVSTVEGLSVHSPVRKSTRALLAFSGSGQADNKLKDKSSRLCTSDT